MEQQRQELRVAEEVPIVLVEVLEQFVHGCWT